METSASGYLPFNVGETDICRLCMKTREYYLNLFVSNEDFSMTIGEAVEDLFDIRVAQGDSLPETVCCLCVTKLIEFRDFKDMCVHSVTELGRLVETITSPIKVEVKGDDVADEGDGNNRNGFVGGECQGPACSNDASPEVLEAGVAYVDKCRREAGADCSTTEEERKSEGTTVYVESWARCAADKVGSVEDTIGIKNETEEKSRSCGAEEEFAANAESSPCVDPLDVTQMVGSVEDTIGIKNETEEKSRSCGAEEEFAANAESSPCVDPLDVTQMEQRRRRNGDILCVAGILRETEAGEDSSAWMRPSAMPRAVLIHSRPERWDCKVCGKVFGRKSVLNRHSVLHTGLKPHPCRFCGRGFADIGNLRKHESRNKRGTRWPCGGGEGSNAGPREWRCEVCGKTFHRRGHLSRHASSVHSGEKPYECSLCPKAFSENASLKKHMVAIHGSNNTEHGGKKGIRTKIVIASECDLADKFKCSVCGETFGKESKLKEHVALHVSSKPFGGKAFVKEGSLKEDIPTNNYGIGVEDKVHEEKKCRVTSCSAVEPSIEVSGSLKGSVASNCDITSVEDKVHEEKKYRGTFNSAVEPRHEMTNSIMEHKSASNDRTVVKDKVHEEKKCRGTFSSAIESSSEVFGSLKRSVASNCDRTVVEDKVHVEKQSSGTLGSAVESIREITGSLKRQNAAERDANSVKDKVHEQKKDAGTYGDGPELSMDSRSEILVNPKTHAAASCDLTVFEVEFHEENLSSRTYSTTAQSRSEMIVNRKTHTAAFTCDGSISRGKVRKGKRSADTSCVPAELISELRSDRISASDGANKLECVVCGKVFKKESELNRHAAVHVGPKPFRCRICGKAFSKYLSLKRHVAARCCGAGFEAEVCEEGRLTGVSRSSLETGSQEFACGGSGEALGSRAHFKGGVVTRSGARSSQRGICAGGSTEKGSRKTTRLRLNPYQCGLCNASFNRKNTLDRHIAHHVGLKPFKCAVCARGFSRLSHLKDHLFCHTDCKPYKCDTCAQEYTQKKSLIRHFAKHGNAKFSCNECGAGFHKTQDLISHSKCHGR